jgi:osmotically-inducible protein OsmY
MNRLHIFRRRSRVTLWLLVAAVVPTLAGCFGAAVVGAGAGALMLADRRPSDTFVADQAVELRAGNRINDKFGDRVHVNVTCYDHTALLTGEASDAAVKADVEKLVAGVPNVKAVINEIQIAGTSTLSARSNDAYVTSKVKARFVDANRFAPNHVKVVTEAGTVYLMGIVTQREADAAVEVARTTAGVMKVVRAFEYIPEEQARQIDNGLVSKSGGDSKPAAPH